MHVNKSINPTDSVCACVVCVYLYAYFNAQCTLDTMEGGMV